MDEEELKEFLEENEGVKLWGEKEIEDFLARADSVGDEEGYVKDFEDKKRRILIEQRPGKTGSIEVRAKFAVPNKSPKQFFDFIEDKDYSATYDSMMKKYEILKKLTKYQSICVYESKQILKWIINGRDFVYVCVHKEVKPDHFVVLSKGCDYDDVYPVPKGTVRGFCHHALFYAKPHPDNKDDTLVIYMASADGRGRIPNWVANWVTRKFAPGYAKNLIKQCLGHEEYLKRKKEEEGKDSDSEEEESESDEDEEEGEEEDSEEESESEDEEEEESASEEDDTESSSSSDNDKDEEEKDKKDT